MNFKDIIIVAIFVIGGITFVEGSGLHDKINHQAAATSQYKSLDK